MSDNKKPEVTQKQAEANIVAKPNMDALRDDVSVADADKARPTGVTNTGEAANKPDDSEERGKLVDEVHDHLVDRLSDLNASDTKSVLDEVVHRISSRKVVAAAPKSRLSADDLEKIEDKVPFLTPSAKPGEPPIRNATTSEEVKEGQSGQLSK